MEGVLSKFIKRCGYKGVNTLTLKFKKKLKWYVVMQ